MSSSRSKGLYAIIFLVFLFFLIFVVFAFFTMSTLKTEDFNSARVFDESRAPIGVIDVKGVILESRKTVDLLLRAEKDKNIKAIVMRINSPYAHLPHV